MKLAESELTARHFAEVYELRVRLACVTRREVAVLVALAQPRIVIRREAVRSQSAGLHAALQRQVLAVELGASRDVEAFVDCYDLHCTAQRSIASFEASGGWPK